MRRLLPFVFLVAMCACGGGGGGGGGSLTSITITPANPSIAIGATQQFTATGNYSDGSTKDLTGSASWLSSTIAVATINNATGLATAIGAGTSTITATSTTVTGSTTLTVGSAASGKIAFVSLRDNDVNQVYVMNADGSNQVRLSSHDGFDPRWSPDGSKVLFSSYKDTSLELWAAKPDGTGETQLTFPTWPADWNAQAAWSFDGTQIAFISYRTTHTQVYTMDSNGNNQVLISNSNNPITLLHNTFTNPSWSPNGGAITADTHWSGGGDAGGIYAFPPSGGTQLTHSGGDYNSAWSPDGAKIAFHRSNSDANPTGNDIYVMNSGGGGETKLAEGINPIWSPDGSKIAFLRDVTGYRLFVMNADGTGQVNLMSTMDNLGTAWTPSWSPDSKMLTFEYGSNIYLINADGTGRVQITSDNQSEVGPQWAPQ